MTTPLYLKIIGEGPPLILLHGWGWHSGIWQSLVPSLVQHYQLFLIDLPGFGNSTVPVMPYTFENIATLIFERVPPQATWLGWSLGGMLAWWIAIHHPEKVKKLITVASSPCFIQKDTWPGVDRLTLEKFATSLINDPQNTLINFLELQTRGSHQSRILFTELKDQLLNSPVPHPDALQGGLVLLRDTDFRPDLKKIRAPSLHLFGRLDRLVPSAVATLLPITTQCEVINHSGHIPFLSEQTQFLTLVNAFMTKA